MFVSHKSINPLPTHLLRLQKDAHDLTDFIVDIKSDEFVQKNQPLTLLGSFLLTILQEGAIFLSVFCPQTHGNDVFASDACSLFVGAYDCRYRVLLRHAAALLGVLWDSFEELEDTLIYCLLNDYVESE